MTVSLRDMLVADLRRAVDAGALPRDTADVFQTTMDLLAMVTKAMHLSGTADEVYAINVAQEARGDALNAWLTARGYAPSSPTRTQ